MHVPPFKHVWPVQGARSVTFSNSFSVLLVNYISGSILCGLVQYINTAYFVFAVDIYKFVIYLY